MTQNHDEITLTLTRKEAEAVLRVLKPFALPYKQEEGDKDLPFAKRAEKDFDAVRVSLIGQMIGKLGK
ncbi:MAG: hypothetical protein AB7S81_07670 [Bdellovibrionales bacterium]